MEKKEEMLRAEALGEKVQEKSMDWKVASYQPQMESSPVVVVVVDWRDVRIPIAAAGAPPAC